ncbi:MAG: TetR/AcrR family transcriptional regulator [Polyangiales bacterium]
MASKIKKSVSESSTDPRSIRSQEALASALLVLLESTPFEQLSIRDIVAEAGIGYTTFFRHHATKEELLDAVAAEQIRCLFQLAVPALDKYDMHAGSTALFTYVHAHRRMWQTLLVGGAAGTVRAEFLRLAREVALQRGDPNAWLPTEIGTLLIVGGTLDLLTWWLRQASPLPIKRMVELHERVVLKPVIDANARKLPQKRKA